MSVFEFPPYEPKVSVLGDCVGGLVHMLDEKLRGAALVVSKSEIISFAQTGKPVYRSVPSALEPVLQYRAENYRFKIGKRIEPFVSVPEKDGQLLLQNDGWLMQLYVNDKYQVYDFSDGKIKLVSYGPAPTYYCDQWKLLVGCREGERMSWTTTTTFGDDAKDAGPCS